MWKTSLNKINSKKENYEEKKKEKKRKESFIFEKYKIKNKLKKYEL